MAVEIVVTPLLFALLGYGLDGWFGTRPVLAFVLGLFGLAGVALRTFYWYQHEMNREQEGKPWTRSQP
jgi:F0F1-type ATP synthase assembly protein I